MIGQILAMAGPFLIFIGMAGLIFGSFPGMTEMWMVGPVIQWASDTAVWTIFAGIFASITFLRGQPILATVISIGWLFAYYILILGGIIA